MKLLTKTDITELTEFRRMLHTTPELPEEEAMTAKAVVEFIAPTKPDRIITEIGGHGIAAIFEGTEPGPTILFRAELDAVPIQEISENPWRSKVAGKAHLCGHEGHTTILCGLARALSRERPKRGRVILMYQPAEENGAGAAAVIADPKFAEIKPDYSFSLHNMPGFPLGFASLAEGPMACASRGLRIRLSGKTSHASIPEDGTSPMQAISQLMPALTALGRVGPLDLNFRLVTITHSSMGEPAFGVAPADAEIWATLRTLRDDRMAQLCADAEAMVRDVATAAGLRFEMDYHDVFRHCDNHPDAVGIFRQAFADESIPNEDGRPMRPSEDFGLFGRVSKSAMFLFGSGEKSPQLHNPDFDFPDQLIEPGARVFMRVVRNMVG